MPVLEATRSLFFAGVFEYGSVAAAAKAFGVPRTTYSDIIRAGKLEGKSRPTVNISEKTAEKVIENLYKNEPREVRDRLSGASQFFGQKLTYNQLNALRKEQGEDSFYKKENLKKAVQKFKKSSSKTKKNSALIRALREIGY